MLPHSSNMESHSRKRARSPVSDNENSCKCNCPHHIKLVLESESPLPTDEDSESVHSIQNASTASPKDTSDTSWSSDPRNMEVEEYEVASLHSDEKLLSNCDSSCTDDMLVATGASVVATAALPLTGDEHTWVESSDTESNCTTDSEVPRADYWECVRCKRECTPLFRFCLKCFQGASTYAEPIETREENISRGKRKKPASGSKEDVLHALALVGESLVKRSKPDSYQTFGDHVASELRMCDGDKRYSRILAEAKRKIFMALYELEIKSIELDDD